MTSQKFQEMHAAGTAPGIETDHLLSQVLRVPVSKALSSSPEKFLDHDQLSKCIKDACQKVEMCVEGNTDTAALEARAMHIFLSIFWGLYTRPVYDVDGSLKNMAYIHGHCLVEECCGPLPVWANWMLKEDPSIVDRGIAHIIHRQADLKPNKEDWA